MVIWSKDSENKSLYGQRIKVVYGTLLVTSIFYNNLSKHLTDHGFTQNKYDMYISNKMVNSKQLTVQFQVDDLKVLHKDQAVLDDFLDKLRSEFGQIDKLTENRRLVYEYLGTTINYLIAGTVICTVFDYLEDTIVECAKDLKNSRSYYPRNDQLLKVVEDSPRLPSKDTELFHCHVIKAVICKQEGEAQHTSICRIPMHTSKITNGTRL